MAKHEGNEMGRSRPRRSRLVAAAAALVGALALAAPAVAGAAAYRPVTITQNASMIVDVSAPTSGAYGTVSWADVSWGDCY
jgi:hypothetical protein